MSGLWPNISVITDHTPLSPLSISHVNQCVCVIVCVCVCVCVEKEHLNNRYSVS